MQSRCKYTKFFLLISVLGLIACNPTRRIQEGEHLLTRNVIIEKTPLKIEKSEIEDYIKLKPNRKLLGIIPFHLTVYNLPNPEKIEGKRTAKNKRIDEKNAKRIAKGKKQKSKDRLLISEWLQEIGEPPSIIDSILVKNSSKQISLFLSNKGYFNNTVKDSVKYKNKRAEVFYIITPGTPYTIRNISYSIDDAVLAYYVFSDTTNSLIKQANNYDVDILEGERERITKELRNSGYYFFSREYIYYVVDSSIGDHRVDITLGIKNFVKQSPDNPDIITESPHQRYYINNVIIRPDYIPNVTDQIKADTLHIDDYAILYSKKLNYKPKVLLDAVFIRKGGLYQAQNTEKTYNRFSNLKAFKLINIKYESSPEGSNLLDCYMLLSPIDKQAFSVELQGTNTSSNLGIAGSIIYQNRNTFKGLEVLEVKMKGGVEAQQLIHEDNETQAQVITPFNTVEFGPEVTLDIPRFLLPFNVKASQNSAPITRFLSAANYQVRPEYTRYTINAAFGYTWKETRQKRHTINPLEIASVKVDKSEAFQSFLEKTNDVLILNSYTDHLVTSSRYTFLFSNQDLTRKTNFTFFRINAEASGNILRGIYNLAGQPKDEDGSYRIFNIKFAQFLRMDVDYRYYFLFGGNRTLVFRTYGGIGKPLHNLRVLPFEKSFAGGGSNGIRAWRTRSLGPGSFQSLSTQNFDQIGDAQWEGNVEYRFKIIGVLNGAFFVDAGNIWLRKSDSLRPGGEFRVDNFYKEIALGTGAGFRVDFSFFVLRFDLGIKMRDPAFGESGRWVGTHLFDKAWKKDFEEFYDYKYSFLNFNLGLGYPF